MAPRRSTARTRASSSAKENGFTTKSSAPRFERADALALGVASRAHDDRHGAVAPDLGQDVEAVDPGQPEVEDDQVGRALEDRPQRGRPVRRLGHPVPGPLEVLVQGRAGSCGRPRRSGSCRSAPSCAGPSSGGDGAVRRGSDGMRRGVSGRLCVSIGIVTFILSARDRPRLESDAGADRSLFVTYWSEIRADTRTSAR